MTIENTEQTITDEQMEFANRIYTTANAMCVDAVQAFGPNQGFSLVMHAFLVSAAQIAMQSLAPEEMWARAQKLAWNQAAVVLAQNAPSSEVKQ